MLERLRALVSSRRMSAALLAAIALGIAAGSYWNYGQEATAVRQEQFRTLAAVGRLKAGEIARWRRERLDDAARSAESPFARQALQQWLASPTAPGLREQWLARLRTEQQSGYMDVLLVAADGRILLSASDDPDPLTDASTRAIDAALASGRPELSALYRGAHGRIHLDTMAPIWDVPGRALAILVLRSDAESYLLPLIESWPVPTRSAETLLVERSGDQVIYLIAPRDGPGRALAQRLQVDRPTLPGAQAVLGKTGWFEGVDHRGVAVLADLRPIPDSPWKLVAQVASDDVLREARRRAAIVALGVASLTLLAALSITLAYRKRQAGLYRSMYEAERGLREAEAEHRAVLDNLPVGIAVNTIDTFRYLNDNFVAFYRTTREALLEPDGFWTAAYEDPRFREEMKARVIADCASGDPDRMFWPDVPITRAGQETTYVTARNTILPDGKMMVSTVWDVTARKRAEEALRQNEEEFRAIFETAAVGMAEADPRTGRWIRVNAKMSEITGYSAGELLSMHIPDITHPADRGRDWEAFQRVVAGHAANYHIEKRYLRKDGAIAWVNVNMNVVRDAGGAPIRTVAVIEDIGERKRSERERETTLAALRLLNLASGMRELIAALTGLIQEWTGCEAVGIRLRDGDDYPYYETRGFPSQFVEAERSLCARDASGLPARDAAGNPVLECMCGNVLCGRFDASQPFFTPKGSFWTNGTTALLSTTTDADRQARTRNRCNGEGYESVALFPLRHGDEVLGLLQVNDKSADRFTAGMISFLEGLADQIALAVAQRQTQARLRESEQFNREVIADAQEGVIVLDRGLRYLVWNPFMEALTGLPSEQVLGKAAIELFPQLLEDGTEDMFRRVLAGETVQSGDRVFTAPASSRSGWYSSVYSPHRDSNGRIIGIIGAVRDVTERKRASAERADLEARLAQAQKIESVGRLAGGVAHDFNNMLSVILGHSELALRQVSPDDPLHGALQEIRGAGQRSAELTRQLLAFARKQTIQPRLLDLNETIGAMLKMLGRLIGEDIELAWTADSGLWPVMMDPAQLDQVLANLTVNARDAIAGQGLIAIRTRNVEVTGESRPSGVPPGRYVLLTVTDDGSGMTPETMEHLFEPFFTTKPQGQGTGLGLATVYGIIQQNHGFIEVESEPGCGTTFQIYLPAHEPATVTAAEKAGVPTMPRGTETVLVVEDEQPLLRLAGQLLERLGYTALTAGSAQEALRVAREHDGEIHLLLTDVIMPQASGRELQRTLSESRPRMKCLFMSGYTADVIAHQGVLDEGIRFLGKPFSIETLAVGVREALDAE